MKKLAGGHKYFLIFLVCFILIFSKNIFAVQIYDYHTEEFINKIDDKYKDFEDYFCKFYDFCFELSLDNMIRDAIKFK